MKKLLAKLIASLEIKEGGFSARKLSSFYAVMIAGLITIWKLPASDQLYALYAWLIFGLLCLSVITAEQLIKFRNGEKGNDPTKPQDEASASHIS